MIFWGLAAGLTALIVRLLIRPLQRRGLATGLALGIPVAALSLYILLGRPELADKSSRPQLPPFLAGTVAKLEAATRADPGDVAGWQLLGEVYTKLKRPAAAVTAFRQAVTQAPGRADLQLALAVALVAAAAGKVIPEAQAIFQNNPDEPLSRYYLAEAKAQAGDWEPALQEWQALQALTPPNAPYGSLLTARIAEAKQALEIE